MIGDAERTKDRRQEHVEIWGQVGWVLGWRHTTAPPPPVSLLYIGAKQGGAALLRGGGDIVILANRRNL
jgi:hypothetical protein